ncbi:Fructose-bisphosphate aldolase 1, partial [Rhizophlyctis rosea]
MITPIGVLVEVVALCKAAKTLCSLGSREIQILFLIDFIETRYGKGETIRRKSKRQNRKKEAPVPPFSAGTANEEVATPEGLLKLLPAGVITGENVRKAFNYARAHKFAIPAVDCNSTSTVNAVLEAARDAKSPIIIQFSNGGAAFFAGKGLVINNQEASILGAVAGAKYVREVAKAYGIPVMVHSDRCTYRCLPWFDGMLAADEEYFAQHGEPLFSSHMLDLSDKSKEENIATCLNYMKKMAKIDCLLEMAIGTTGGGEEDGVNNASLYTQPEDIWDIYSQFSQITDLFTIAAAFGNVHGVYTPGNVCLRPEMLGEHQAHVAEKAGTRNKKPLYFVFHGGSGPSPEEIQTAVGNGVVTMTIDTDTQWAYWTGIHGFKKVKEAYLQAQTGKPDTQKMKNDIMTGILSYITAFEQRERELLRELRYEKAAHDKTKNDMQLMHKKNWPRVRPTTNASSSSAVPPPRPTIPVPAASSSAVPPPRPNRLAPASSSSLWSAQPANAAPSAEPSYRWRWENYPLKRGEKRNKYEVSNPQIGLIIGERGAILKQLQKDFSDGADRLHIEYNKDQMAEVRTVFVTGKREKVDAAEREMKRRADSFRLVEANVPDPARRN